MRGSESEEDEDGSTDIGGRGVKSSGFAEGSLLRNVGDEGRFSSAGSLIGSGEDEGDAAWIVAVLCGLWYESVKTDAGRERTRLSSFWVRLGVKSWDTSQLGREGGEKAYLCGVSVLLAALS